VFLEANVCGLPVIAGRDAVRHGGNGLVVDGRSVDDILAAMHFAARGHRRARAAPERRSGRGGTRRPGARTQAFLAFCLG